VSSRTSQFVVGLLLATAIATSSRAAHATCNFKDREAAEKKLAAETSPGFIAVVDLATPTTQGGRISVEAKWEPSAPKLSYDGSERVTIQVTSQHSEYCTGGAGAGKSTTLWQAFLPNGTQVGDGVIPAGDADLMDFRLQLLYRAPSMSQISDLELDRFGWSWVPSGYHVMIEKTYTVAQLRELINAAMLRSGFALRLSNDDVARSVQSFGVKAWWWSQKNGLDNDAPVHFWDYSRMAGTSIDVPYSAWGTTGGLKLPGRNRAIATPPAVLKARPAVKDGGQVATNLETEAEYRFTLDPSAQRELAIKLLTNASAVQDALTQEGAPGWTISTSDKPIDKQYIDRYYDIVEGGRLPLLTNGLVARTRWAEGEPTSGEQAIDLFSIKGRSELREGAAPGERIRLTGQIYLKGGAAQQDPGALFDLIATPTLLQAFPKEALPLPAIAADLLGRVGIDLAKERRDAFRPVLEVESSRKKFVFTHASGTTVELTIDTSTGFPLDDKGARASIKPVVFHGFEFGLEHPGRTGSVEDKGVSTRSEAPFNLTWLQARVASRTLFTPADLDQTRFLDPDYGKFTSLRDAVLRYLALDPQALAPGGHKAHDLACALGMIKERCDRSLDARE
jgi:hypothetical protein